LSTETIRSENRAAHAGKTLLRRIATLSNRVGTPIPTLYHSRSAAFFLHCDGVLRTIFFANGLDRLPRL